MMTVEPFLLVDPELLIPSAEGAEDLHFWHRLLSWIDIADWRVGPASLEAFQEAIDDLSPSSVSKHDFWAIVGKVVQRGFVAAVVDRQICEVHLRMAYSPILGAADNAQLLVQDLLSVGESPHIALATDSECWEGLDSECVSCSYARVHLMGAPEVAALDFARAWRTSFLDRCASDMVQLERFAAVMFPNIIFSGGAWRRVGSLLGAPSENVPGLVAHLGVLNDCAVSIWDEQPTTVARQAGLGSLGVDSSPESPNTLRNQSARRTRMFSFGTKEVECLWHTKLRPEGNRVHFAVENDRVYVGAIVDHLAT